VAFAFNVQLNDPNQLSQDAALVADMQAAAADWSRYLNGLGVINIQINITPTTRANGAPGTTVPSGTDGARTVYEPGTIYEMVTGTDPNGASPDVIINIDPTHLQNTLWLDPNPTNPSPIPSNRVDAVSVLRHELGHGFGIVGWRDLNTGSLPATYESSWDKLVQLHADGSAWFTGIQAEAVYGGPVPVTTLTNGEQYFHLGNGTEADSSDLMNGVTFRFGTSYQISALDLAILKDLGMPEVPMGNPPPAPATAADMILRHGADGLYEIYDIGNNAILAAYQLGQVGTDWKFVGLGNFFGNDTTDMLLRSATSGGFEVYDISNNNITNAASLGAVGLNWQVMGFGNFSSLGETDMIMRNANSGGVEVYDIRDNQIIGAGFMGAVGLNWQFSGVGNFSGRGEGDMMLRDSNTGGLEVYDINNNQITGAAFIGAVGTNWQFSGVGNFSGVPGETDLLLRNANTGGLEVYDINNNQLTGAAFIGNVGVDWQYAGVAPISGAGRSDLVLRNVNSGVFEVYDVANNQLTGAASLGSVGTDWQLGGFAVDPPTGPTGSAGGSDQAAQLAQAMAGFGGGAAASLNTAPLGSDPSQQPLLTTPQHA
jgi:hypothetical protein